MPTGCVGVFLHTKIKGVLLKGCALPAGTLLQAGISTGGTRRGRELIFAVCTGGKNQGVDQLFEYLSAVLKALKLVKRSTRRG